MQQVILAAHIMCEEGTVTAQECFAFHWLAMWHIPSGSSSHAQEGVMLCRHHL